MTLHTTDNTSFWRLVAQHLRYGSKDYYGDQPCLPADALLAVCRKLSAQTNPQP
jgi:hypothetical protein